MKAISCLNIIGAVTLNKQNQTITSHMQLKLRCRYLQECIHYFFGYIC